MVRQSCSELNELEFHSPPLVRREIDLVHKTQGSDFVSNQEERQSHREKNPEVPASLYEYTEVNKR